MIVSTIRQLLDSEPGPVEAVNGIVTAVYDRITGGEGKKAWAIQNLMLSGDDGSKLKVKMWRRPEFDKVKCIGHRLYIVSAEGKRGGGRIGLKTEMDSYQGKTHMILTVQESCEVTFQAPAGMAQAPVHANANATRPAMAPTASPTRPAAPAPAPAPAPEPYVEPPPSDSDYLPSPAEMGQYAPIPHIAELATMILNPAQPAAPVQPAGPVDAKAAWSKADHTLNKYRRAYLRCISVASKVQEDGRLMGVEIPATGIQELATTFFIQMTRDGTMLSVPNIDPPNLPQF